MKEAVRHLDVLFSRVRPLTDFERPAKGWIRAIRNALGMTTHQLARRLGVAQSRVVEMEKAEISGSLTLNSLNRAANALGCRVVYLLVPEEPLNESIDKRLRLYLQAHQKSIAQSMKLEEQAVPDGEGRAESRNKLVEALLGRLPDCGMTHEGLRFLS